MINYIDAEKLKAEIERRQKENRYDELPMTIDRYYKAGRYYEDRDLLAFIDSLQKEQPEVNFKVKERKWVHDAVDNVFPEDGDFMSEFDFRKIIKDTARHFYELGFNTRKEK